MQWCYCLSVCTGRTEPRERASISCGITQKEEGAFVETEGWMSLTVVGAGMGGNHMCVFDEAKGLIGPRAVPYTQYL